MRLGIIGLQACRYGVVVEIVSDVGMSLAHLRRFDQPAEGFRPELRKRVDRSCREARNGEIDPVTTLKLTPPVSGSRLAGERPSWPWLRGGISHQPCLVLLLEAITLALNHQGWL